MSGGLLPNPSGAFTAFCPKSPLNRPEKNPVIESVMLVRGFGDSACIIGDKLRLTGGRTEDVTGMTSGAATIPREAILTGIEVVVTILLEDIVVTGMLRPESTGEVVVVTAGMFTDRAASSFL